MRKILLLLFLTNILFAKETIVWMIWDLPPNFISKGPLKNKGYEDIRLKMIQDKLPQYNHEAQIMNFNRAVSIFKDKDDSKKIYCANDMVSHKSLDFDDYMSMASFPFKGQFLVTSLDKAHLFTKNAKNVVLKDILENEKLKLVLSKNRPYLDAGIIIKEYLIKNPSQNHITEMSTLNTGLSMFNFVLKGRADYTLEYVFRATYYSKLIGKSNQFFAIPIKENDGVFYGYHSCVKTKKGKKVIDEIDEIIRELKSTDAWMQPFVDWMPTATIKENYIKYYKEVFLEKGDIYDDNPRSR